MNKQEEKDGCTPNVLNVGKSLACPSTKVEQQQSQVVPTLCLKSQPANKSSKTSQVSFSLLLSNIIQSFVASSKRPNVTFELNVKNEGVRMSARTLTVAKE